MRNIKVKRSFLNESGFRLDASYHLSEGVITKRKFENPKYPVRYMGEITKDIFKGNIFKRTYVDNGEMGYPFLTASDMMKLNLESGKFISRKYSEVDNLKLKKGWILVSRSGTLGNTVYTNEDFEKYVGTDDLIRIIPNEKELPSGFLYAFLSSKYGHGLLTQSGYGGVVKHIEPHHIVDLPVPIFPKEKQTKIHQLIGDAAELRVEASRLLEEALNLFEGKYNLKKDEKIFIVNTGEILRGNKRLEASFNSNIIKKFYENLNEDVFLRSVEEVSKEVFTPNIFKRIRTESPEKGVAYLSGAELLQQFPKFNSFLSKGMKNIQDYILKDGWLAIQDAGTIGYVTYVNKYLDGVSATNNLIRIIPAEDKNYNYYIYCFLKSSIGQNVLKALEFGSVQKHIDNHQVKRIKVPIFKDIFNQVSNSVRQAMENFGTACFIEKKAISLIEKEIDLWEN